MIIPPNWTPRELGTLVFLEQDDSVLLIHKKRGHGAGKINGPGGRVEPGETPEACARREVREEVGLLCRELTPAAELRFDDIGNGFSMRGFVFRGGDFEGQPVETDEARPFWCSWDALPFGDMWEDDRYWLPSVRAHRPVRGDFQFDNDKLVRHRIEFVETLEFA